MWDLFYLQRTLGIFLDHVQDLKKCWLKIVIVEKKEAFFFVKIGMGLGIRKITKGFFVGWNFGLLVRKLSQ